MTHWFDRLNLAPTERRMAIVGLCVMGLLFNYWFIWPYFAEWDIMVRERTKLEGQKQIYFKEVSKKSSYEKLLKELDLSNIHEVPKVVKVTVNRGLGEAAQNAKALEIGRASCRERVCQYV